MLMLKVERQNVAMLKITELGFGFGSGLGTLGRVLTWRDEEPAIPATAAASTSSELVSVRVRVRGWGGWG
jgi:hypothetical protein